MNNAPQKQPTPGQRGLLVSKGGRRSGRHQTGRVRAMLRGQVGQRGRTRIFSPATKDPSHSKNTPLNAPLLPFTPIQTP